MGGISTQADTASAQFMLDLLVCGAPANDCTLRRTKMPQGPFSALVLARAPTGQCMIGLAQPSHGHVFVVSVHEDDSDVIALWRQLSARLSLPLAVGLADGAIEMISEPYPPQARRRGSVVAQRRTRFSAQRQIGCRATKVRHSA
jgi:hypothetical protein